MQIIKPLRHRDYRLLWAGQSISLLGDGVGSVALAWQAYSLTNRASTISVVLIARTVPLLALLLLGGAITDRASRRLLMLATDLIRGIVMAVVAILAATGTLQVWHLIVGAALFGSADAFFFPAATAILPELVPEEDLARANALEGATRPLMMRMIGPALGGAMVATLGTRSAFGLDAFTFFVSTACLLAIRARPAPVTQTDSTILRDISRGFAYTRRQPWIWATLIMAAFAVLCFVGPFDVLVPVFAKRRLHGAGGFGLVVSAMGIGGILGAIVSPLVSFAFMPISYALVAPISSAIGVGPTLAGGGILASVITLAFMLYPRILEPDRPNYTPEPFPTA